MSDHVKGVVNIPGWAEYFQGETDRIPDAAASYAVPLVYRAVNMLCDALSSVPVHVFQGEREVDFPFDVDLVDLIWHTQAGLLLDGAAFWIPNPNGKKTIQCVNPFSMSVETRGGAVVFRQNSAGLEWAADKLVYFRTHNPNDDIGKGISAARVALTNARMLRYIDRFASYYFEQGAQPVTLLAVDQAASSAEIARLENWFTRAATNIRNAFRVLGVRAGSIEPTVLTPPLKDLAMPELQEQARKSIALAFGIPQTMLEDAANYATATEHTMQFWTGTIRPAGARIESAINRQLLARKGLRFEFAFDELDIFQEDEAQRAGALSTLTGSGFDIQTAIEVLGYELTDEQLARVLAANAPKPAPEPEPETETDTDEADTQEAEDLKRWQRKAVKWLERGKDLADMPFETNVTNANTIRAALAECKTREDIARVFAGVDTRGEMARLADEIRAAREQLQAVEWMHA